jgi:hypothetical protein
MSSNADSRDDDVSHAIKRQIADWFNYGRRLGCRETPQSIRRRAAYLLTGAGLQKLP